jgi:protein phosphatase
MVQPAAISSPPAISVAHKTDPGRDPDKQVNEDSCGYGLCCLGHVLVVCDGMGGHMSGREASQRAVGTIFQYLEAVAPTSAPGVALRTSVERAGRAVYDLGGPSSNALRPGSTCVAMLLHSGGLEIAHVGDSRGYLFRGGQVYPITKDHSMVQQMVDAGILRPEEAIGHPEANKITRALGMIPDVDVELRPTPLTTYPGDIILICSDGLCDLVMPNDMLAIVQATRAAGGITVACDKLVELANERGGHDNITVLMAEVLEGTKHARALRTVPAGVVADVNLPAKAPPAPTVGDMPALSAVQPGATIIDDSASAGPGQTWVGDEPESVLPKKSKRATWISMGIILILIGLVMAGLCLSWIVYQESRVGLLYPNNENLNLGRHRASPAGEFQSFRA